PAGAPANKRAFWTQGWRPGLSSFGPPGLCAVLPQCVLGGLGFLRAGETFARRAVIRVQLQGLAIARNGIVVFPAIHRQPTGSDEPMAFHAIVRLCLARETGNRHAWPREGSRHWIPKGCRAGWRPMEALCRTCRPIQ